MPALQCRAALQGGEGLVPLCEIFMLLRQGITQLHLGGYFHILTFEKGLNVGNMVIVQCLRLNLRRYA